jgi:hypothetical protein
MQQIKKPTCVGFFNKHAQLITLQQVQQQERRQLQQQQEPMQQQEQQQQLLGQQQEQRLFRHKQRETEPAK